jgi:zinc ribbon protein
MPKFCTKCGSPLSEGLRFCSNCGTPVAEAASVAPAPPRVSSTSQALAPAAAVAAVPAPARAVAAPASAAPAKQGSSALKIVLIVVLVIFLIITAAIGACVYMAYRIKNRVQGEMQQIHATGQTGGKTGTAAATVIPPYPGATAVNSGFSIGGAQGGLSGQEYETTDSVDQVVGFYKDKLGPKANVNESNGKTTLTLFSNNGIDSVVVSREESAGKTRIDIGHLGK